MMETVALVTSSDDDDDVYLNSVAKLKALTKQVPLQSNKEITEKKEETEIEGIISTKPMITRSKKTKANKSTSGPRTRSQRRRKNSVDHDSDVEIVSVENMVNAVVERPIVVEEKINSVEKNDVVVVEKIIDSSEDENYDINIKILWRSKNMHRLSICQNENFQKIFEHFANLEGVSTNEIMLTKRDRTIKKTDTPTSINLSVIDILEGGVIKKDTTEEKPDEDACIIKVQTTNKKSLTISVKQDESFKALWEKCAEELNIEEAKMKLYFDGELVKITDTPNSLDIEDEACFDLRLSS
ncbi:DNA repair protein Rad60 isoform X2 [Nomia melanderi]|uniref:DNA repair protein Rad60 isoform X2 n=1 Tax=Nomia melanderi TaxID=2448451 RepID=UPI0013045F6E|nr:uncharacterized protein CG4449 isoform X2 [Nomia melanderi]